MSDPPRHKVAIMTADSKSHFFAQTSRSCVTEEISSQIQKPKYAFEVLVLPLRTILKKSGLILSLAPYVTVRC
jgi:aspartokinase-like uncharacterized kinase